MPDYLDDVEEAKNRTDKSILAIRTMCPEKLLIPDVAFPNLVKHLLLDVRFDSDDYCDMEKYLFRKDCNCPKIGCNLCDWSKKYTNTLCKDLVNFDQLETLIVEDLNLRSDLWTQFAQNSKYLREIEFTSGCSAGQPYDYFCFDGEFDDSGDHKEKALEAILKIPTLKKASFLRLELPFFPKGPSNIDHLELYVEPYVVGGINYEKYDYTNFASHTNLKSLDICQGEIAPLPFYSLNLEKLVNLEEIIFNGYFEDDRDINSLKNVLNLPKLKGLFVILKQKRFNIELLLTMENSENYINLQRTINDEDQFISWIENLKYITNQFNQIEVNIDILTFNIKPILDNLTLKKLKINNK